MNAVTGRRLTLYLRSVGLVTAGGTFFGIMVASAYFPTSDLRGTAFGALAGAISALAISAVIGGLEIFVPHTRLGRVLDRAPFLATLAIKSFVYSAVIVAVVGSRIGRWLAACAVFGAGFARRVLEGEGMPVVVSIIVTFMAASFAILLMQLAGLIGGRTLRDIVLGRYHRPRMEERFFLFVDIVGSTPLAERLGPASVHEFLNRVFQIASDPIDDHGGEVYQYVGDEVVVTWTLAQGRLHSRPIACYLAIERALQLAAADFESEFGAVPRLRAALHAGPVIAGEVGGTRRSIVFHGDVMNTASRIENATRDLQCSFLVSEDALRRIDGIDAYTFVDLGLTELRGRAAPMRLFSLGDVTQVPATG